MAWSPSIYKIQSVYGKIYSMISVEYNSWNIYLNNIGGQADCLSFELINEVQYHQNRLLIFIADKV